MNLICIGCKRQPAEIEEFVDLAQEDGGTPDDAAREDGTFNPENGHFACTSCYIDMGMPTSPEGWKAP